MKTYIVRTWVDLKIKAESAYEAKELSNETKIEVKETDKVVLYDMQTADVWEREN